MERNCQILKAEEGIKRTDGLKFKTDQLEIRHNLLTVQVINHWSRLQRDVVDIPSLDVIKPSLDAFLEDML